MISIKGKCLLLTHAKTEAIDSLKTEFEEADLRVMTHVNHALREDADKTVILRSPFGDTDINCLAVALFQSESEKERLFLDSGPGNRRSVI